MYNGIGLQTARGSGTNGYVQRNLSAIRTVKDKVNFRTEEDIQRFEADIQKGPNQDILEHARKRALELKCAEMEDIMKDEGYLEHEIVEKVKLYREMLMERDQNAKAQNHSAVDMYGRPTVRETHAVAEAQQQKNARLKEAFGISEFFVEGSSLDPDRKNKEEAARQAHNQQEEERRKRRHEWISTPTPSPTHPSSEHKDKKDKKKKKKRTRDRSSSPDSRKKRKSKKSKRSR